MKLKRFFASFSLVLLLFSVSVPLCFADEATSSSDFVLGINFAPPTVDPGWESKMVYIPSAQEYGIYNGTTGSASGIQFYLVAQSNYYKPATYDRTVFLSIGYTSSAGRPAFSAGGDMPDLSYNIHDSNSLLTYPDAVRYAGAAYQSLTTHGDIATMRITIPANSTAFKFSTDGYMWWSLPTSSPYILSSFGGYIIESADEAILSAIQTLIDRCYSMNLDLANLIYAVNQILGQCYNLQADTQTIVSLLNSLTSLSESQLSQLEKISTSVDAIYFFLTEALKSDSEDASQAVQDTVNSIDNSHASEAYWQTSMQGNYDSLDLEHFSFGGITGGIELVGRIFTDMWSAFGEYQILFTFPLVLGIALLVIGRISKFGGGNSSRNKEHKGGEGGA